MAGMETGVAGSMEGTGGDSDLMTGMDMRRPSGLTWGCVECTTLAERPWGCAGGGGREKGWYGGGGKLGWSWCCGCGMGKGAGAGAGRGMPIGAMRFGIIYCGPRFGRRCGG